jgi:hypothetical protein
MSRYHLLLVILLPWWLPAIASGNALLAGETHLPDAIDEASGLAHSVLHPDLLWIHNDNINDPGSIERVTPYVHGLSEAGKPRVRLELADVTQRDWESIDAARIDGEATLIVADSGDNLAIWPDYVLWFVAEPDSLVGRNTDRRISPRALLRYRYPEGPADTEAMVFDPLTGQILLLTKEERPRLYRLPVDARRPFPRDPGLPPSERLHSAPVEKATLVGRMARLSPTDPINWLLLPLTGSQTNRPTGMALGPDDRLLAVLTYASVYFFKRKPANDWAEAIRRPVASRSLPRIDQWEGLAFTADGRHLRIVREGTGPGAMIRLDVPERVLAP